LNLFGRDNNGAEQAPPQPPQRQLPPLRSFIIEREGKPDTHVAAHTVDFMPNGGVFFVEGIPLPDGRIINRFVGGFQKYDRFYETAAPGLSSLSIS